MSAAPLVTSWSPAELSARQTAFDQKLRDPRRAGYQVRFDGELAGLWDRSASGDRNDAANYMLVCVCGADLGQLGRYRPNSDRRRTPRCTRCDTVLVVGPEGQVERTMRGVEWDAFVQLRQAKDLAEKKRQLDEEIAAAMRRFDQEVSW